MKKNKFYKIAGLTLVEILIGIVISSIMMAAMYTSYTLVNNSYSQVVDRAKISQSGRDIIGMMLRDIRMAGFKFYGDTIKGSVSNFAPIVITKSSVTSACCDKIEIVYGDVDYDPAADPKYKFVRFKITYSGKASKIIDKNTGNPIPLYAIYKSKLKWDEDNLKWFDTKNDGDNRTFDDEIIVDYVEDMEFIAIDEVGKKINPPPSTTNATKDKLYKIRIVDMILTFRSAKEFYKTNQTKTILAIGDTIRNITKSDKYLRDSVVVSAHARNLGLQ